MNLGFNSNVRLGDTVYHVRRPHRRAAHQDAGVSHAAAGLPPPLELRLLHPGSWLAGGQASLPIEVEGRGTGELLADVDVEGTLEGTPDSPCFVARTDAQGRSELSFPFPRPALDAAALLIRTTGTSAREQTRSSLRPKPRTAPPPTP